MLGPSGLLLNRGHVSLPGMHIVNVLKDGLNGLLVTGNTFYFGTDPRWFGLKQKILFFPGEYVVKGSSY